MEGNLRSYTTNFFKKNDIFSGDFIKKCEDNANGDQFVTLEVNSNIKIMAMEQGLYAQEVKLR